MPQDSEPGRTPVETGTSEAPPTPLRPANEIAGRGGVFGAAWQVVIQTIGFVRKEVLEVLRQPRLLLVMVVGPFLVLALFAFGFDQQRTVLTTRFVGPANGPYESSLDDFADQLGRYVANAGYTSDLVGARNELANGDIDLIVIFPEDPSASVLAGEQAPISVLHDKIDPIQQTTVEVAAQVAVQELNATILERIVGEIQGGLVPYEDSVTEASTLIDAYAEAQASGDAEAMSSAADELGRNAQALDSVVDTTSAIVADLGGTADRQDELDELLASISEYQQAAQNVADLADRGSPEDVAALRLAVSVVEERGSQVTTLDPRVLVRPFAGETESFQRQNVSIQSFFAPAAIALLLQHMVLTFAAMSLVSDRALGLFELYRVGPIRSGRILLGKSLAFLLVGAVAAAALLGSVRVGLGVPFRGEVGWVAVAVAGLLASSIALGLVISLVAKSDTQAVQYALLALLAGLFFSGFFLDLDAFRYPFKGVAWLMPVTYGVRLLRDVMLRGAEPSPYDLAGLVGLTIAYGGSAWFFLARRLRVR